MTPFCVEKRRDRWNSSACLGDTSVQAFGINAAGVAVGSSGTDSSNAHATLWVNAPQDLGVIADNTFNQARAINDLGTVVGIADTAAGRHAMVWTAADGMRDLNDASDAAQIGITLEVASAINASGQIVGNGRIGANVHGFLATPVPESAASWPALGCLGWLAHRRARRQSACRGRARHAT